MEHIEYEDAIHVDFDVAALPNPISVDAVGRLSLDEAQRLRDEIGAAINAVEAALIRAKEETAKRNAFTDSEDLRRLKPGEARCRCGHGLLSHYMCSIPVSRCLTKCGCMSFTP